MTRRALLLDVGTASRPVVTPVAEQPGTWMPQVYQAPPLPALAAVTATAVSDGMLIEWTLLDARESVIVEVGPSNGDPLTGPWTRVAEVTAGANYFLSMPNGSKVVRVTRKRNGILSAPVNLGLLVPFDPEFALLQMTSDGVLSRVEKSAELIRWTATQNELSDIDAKADAHAVSRIAFDAAFTALNTYILSLSPPLSDVTQDTPIVGPTYRAKWTAYLDARTLLLNAIAAKAKALSDVAQSTAETANAAANTAQTTADSKIELFVAGADSPPTASTVGDQWYVPDTKETRYWNGIGWSLLADQTSTNSDFVGVKTTVTSTGRGNNLIRNSSFAVDERGWWTAWDSASYGNWSVIRYIGTYGDGDTNRYAPRDVNALSIRRWGLMANNTYYVHGTVNPRMPIKGGETFIASVYANAFRCGVRITVGFYDASGNNLYEPGAPLQPYTNQVNPTRANQVRIETGRITAPANAVSMSMLLWLHGTDQWDPVALFWEPQIEIAAPTQTLASPYSARGDDLSESVPASVDLVDDTDPLEGNIRRIGLRKLGSRHQLAGPRNMPSNQVMGYGAVNTAVPLSATSAGAVTVNAFTVNLNGETVSYNAVSNAVTGLAVGTTYVIYCIDPYADGGTRTWYAATSVLAAQSAAMGVVVAGTVAIPTSGSTSGGDAGTGNPDDWCVDWDSVLPDGRYVRDLQVGDLVECIDVATGETGLFPLLAISFGEANCYRLNTPEGCAVRQSECTAMDMFDGTKKRTPEMFGQGVWAKIKGVWKKTIVNDLQFLGKQRVVKPDFGDRMFPAGEDKDYCIATHNLRAK